MNRAGFTLLAALLMTLQLAQGRTAAAQAIRVRRAEIPVGPASGAERAELLRPVGSAQPMIGGPANEPFEQRASRATIWFFKAVRRLLVRSARFGASSVSRWADRLTIVLVLFLIALVAPLVDRTLLRTWRERGFRGLWISLVLGAAVYVRLLIDIRAPVVGKGLLAIALLYGVIRHDLVPDWGIPLGFLDDLIVVVLAARWFMHLCPDPLVQEHAAKAARARERSLRRRRPPRRLPLR